MPPGPLPKSIGTQFAAIAAVKHVDVVAVHLIARLDDVTAVRVNQHIIKLGHGGREFLCNARGSEILQRPAVNVGNRTASKPKLRQTIDSGGIAIQHANRVPQGAHGRVERGQTVRQFDVVLSETCFVEQVGRKSMIPTDNSALQVGLVHHIAQQGLGVDQRIVLVALSNSGTICDYYRTRCSRV